MISMPHTNSTCHTLMHQKMEEGASAWLSTPTWQDDYFSCCLTSAHVLSCLCEPESGTFTIGNCLMRRTLKISKMKPQLRTYPHKLEAVRM